MGPLDLDRHHEGAILMGSTVFIVLVTLLSLLSLVRLTWSLGAVIAMYLLFPAVAYSAVVGTQLAQFGQIYPATYLVAGVFAVQLVLRPREVTLSIAGRYWTTAAVAFFLVAALVFTGLSGTSNGLALIINQAAAPFAFFVLVRMRGAEDPGSVRWLSRLFVLIAAGEAVLAVAVRSGVTSQPFDEFLQTFPWYLAGTTRALGTTDHPLVLGAVMVIAIPLAVTFRRVWVQVVLIGLLVVGIFATESRTSLGLAAITIGLVVFRSSMNRRSRVLLLVGTATAVAMLAVSSLSAGVADRLADDGGSSSARVDAWRAGFGLSGSHFFSGDGTGANAGAAFYAGLGTTFENPFLMYLVDYGLVATVAYFAALIYTALVVRGKRVVPTSVYAVGVGIVSTLSFSSVATINNLGGILWFSVALAAVAVKDRSEQRDEGATERAGSVLRDTSSASALTRSGPSRA